MFYARVEHEKKKAKAPMSRLKEKERRGEAESGALIQCLLPFLLTQETTKKREKKQSESAHLGHVTHGEDRHATSLVRVRRGSGAFAF